MNQPTPAIVAQDAVRRLPRAALWLFCVAYVVPGFLGRGPWKSADITGFGHMWELARGHADWLAPTLLGQAPEFDALLPYWIGAWAIRIAPGWISPDLAARIPFALLLALTLTCTWYAVYHLARSPRAQPVPFAFGGEAEPRDYARALADGGLLALVACLGLAQFSHETTPSLAQLAFGALTFYGIAALPHRFATAVPALIAGLAGLSLSGAPSMALLFGLGGILVTLSDRQSLEGRPAWQCIGWLLAGIAIAAALSTSLHAWRWRLHDGAEELDWPALGRLLLWFTWPAGPLALFAVWRWRLQLTSRHVALPLWLAIVALASMVSTPSTDRSLLLALPALAALSAFALPTLGRTVSAVIDWFTLLFFSVCAIAIWVVWFSLNTGVPAKPAANVARLAPTFVPTFSWVALAAALVGTVAWLWLVRWRTGRHRQVIWKSLVLPASGTALCWLLLMTLWLPALDYGRSYAPLVRNVLTHVNLSGCVEELGMSRAQISAFLYHGRMDLRPFGTAHCDWLLMSAPVRQATPAAELKGWRPVTNVRRPSDSDENILIYRRSGPR